MKCINQSGEKTIHFDEGETIRIEDSHKFTNELTKTLLTNANFQIEHIWSDEHKWINIILARIPYISLWKNLDD